MALVLISGAPRLGMTTANKFASLHNPPRPKKAQMEASTIEDIYAPPESDESDEVVELDVKDEWSAEHDFGAAAGEENGKSDPQEGMKQEKSGIIEKEDGNDSVSDMKDDPADIKSSVWEVRKQPGREIGSQSSQKRRGTSVDDGEPFDIYNASQSKKVKTGYGASSQKGVKKAVPNIHHGPAAKTTKMESKSPTTSISVQDESGFKHPQPESWMAMCNQHTEPNEVMYKKPPSIGASPRSQRASQRSSRSTQASSQTTPKKAFKVPPKCSPKKEKQAGPVFKTFQVSKAAEEPKKTTRSSVPDRKPMASADPSTKDNRVFREAVKIATDKLQMPDVSLKVPPSSISIPSYSPDSDTQDSPLSSIPSDENEYPMITAAEISLPRHDSLLFHCPVCKEPVDSAFWDANNCGNQRLSLRRQVEFCRAYKKRNADFEWQNSHYPEIDWSKLNERLVHFHAALEDILHQRRPSFYRNSFDDLVKSRKDRPIKQNVLTDSDFEDMSPGYYGSRGAKIMMENIMARFASKMRRLAASDRLISSGGVSGFVQAVLIPELAVLLIKEDMKIDDEDEARTVLRNSVEIGQILNEEEDETIKDPDPDEKPPVEII